MKDEFSRVHPLINFIYFGAVIAFSAIYMSPPLICISLGAAFCYSFYLDGKKALKFFFAMALPIGLFAALINIAFNHNGMTILMYFPTGNPLTLESVAYGTCAAALLTDVIMWFFCFNRVITSDKFIYLFGRIIPSLSLVLSMILRFIPRFRRQYQRVATAQKSLKKADGKQGLFAKIKRGMNTFSIMLTWSLENSITMADSMNARGYGLKGRTAFSRYRFYFRDGVLLAAMILLLAGQIIFTILGCGRVSYYPYFELVISPVAIAGYICYGLMCLMPMIINLTEDVKWNYFRSEI